MPVQIEAGSATTGLFLLCVRQPSRMVSNGMARFRYSPPVHQRPSIRRPIAALRTRSSTRLLATRTDRKVA